MKPSPQLEGFFAWLIVAALVAMVFGFCAWVTHGGDRPEAHEYQKFRGKECEVCSRTNDLEWAHFYAYNMDKGTTNEWRITDPKLGCTLCRKCHESVAHYNNFSKYWNTNLLHIVKELREARQEYK